MADNYLERKMEELRSGKRVAVAGVRTGKGMLSFPLPEKRVLVVGSGPQGLITAICGDFSRVGCKVALISDDSLPQIEGIRHYRAVAAEAFGNLLKAWRDVDVMILVDRELDGVLLESWTAHKRAYPIPTDYGGRVIVFGESVVALTEELREAGVTSNCISCGAESWGADSCGADAECVRRTLLFLALPTSKGIDDTVFKIR